MSASKIMGVFAILPGAMDMQLMQHIWEMYGYVFLRHAWPKSFWKNWRSSGISWTNFALSSIIRIGEEKTIRASFMRTWMGDSTQLECMFVHRQHGLVSVSTCGDDTEMAGKEQTMVPMWKKLMNNADSDEPTSFLQPVWRPLALIVNVGLLTPWFFSVCRLWHSTSESTLLFVSKWSDEACCFSKEGSLLVLCMFFHLWLVFLSSFGSHHTACWTVRKCLMSRKKNRTHKLWRCLMKWKDMLKNALSDVVNWQTRKLSNLTKSQAFAWMIINPSWKKPNLLEARQKFAH